MIPTAPPPQPREQLRLIVLFPSPVAAATPALLAPGRSAATALAAAVAATVEVPAASTPLASASSMYW